MEKNKKNNLITARLSDDDLEALNDLSDRTDKNTSDTITRALKFWTRIEKITEDENEQWGKVKKNHRVCVRMSDDDMNAVDKRCEETGLSVGQVVRRAIREYHRTMKELY